MSIGHGAQAETVAATATATPPTPTAPTRRREPPRELTRDQLLPDTVQSLYRQTGVALAGHLLGALVLIALFAGTAPTAVLGVWGGLFAVFWLLRLATLLRYHASEHSRRDAENWLLWWNLGALVFGAAWGAAVWLLYPHGRAHQQAALLVIAYGYCVGAIPLLANQYRIFLGFISLAFEPTILRLVTLGGPMSWYWPRWWRSPA